MKLKELLATLEIKKPMVLNIREKSNNSGIVCRADEPYWMHYRDYNITSWSVAMKNCINISIQVDSIEEDA